MQADRAKKRDELMKETYDEIMGCLREHKKCMLIRPTGFGKTYIIAHITKEFKRTLYLYPLDIVRLDMENKYKEVTGNVRCLSYMGLVNLYKANKDNLKVLASKYDLIVCDEAHMVGAEQTSIAIKELIEEAKESCILGATATPYRSDSYDVTEEIFDGRVISEYNLSDAINDGIILKPYYIYSVYEVVNSLTGALDIVDNCVRDSDKEQLKKEIKAIEIEMGRLLNAPEVIKSNINKIYPDLDYMKFIVFFSEKASLRMKRKEVLGWFEQAFPEKTIRYTTITSEIEYRNNVNELDRLSNTKGTIDIIFCINMLNMGYHIEDLTGILMLRGTASDIIYKQQIGRCLSVESDRATIIFDLVNNIFKKPYYVESVRSQQRGINVDEISAMNSRINRITMKELVVNDMIATYQQMINRIIVHAGQVNIERAILYYKNNAKIKDIVRLTRIKESVLRHEIAKRGLKMRKE